MTVTIKDIANAANVSDTTVSFVLKDDSCVSDATKEIVLDKIRELGYRPHKVARGLRLSRTNILALLLPEIGNKFVKEIFQGVESYANEKGYNIIISTTHGEDERRTERFIDQLGHGLIDGLIFIPMIRDDYTEEIMRVREWIEEKIPLVMIDIYFKEVDCNFVVTDNTEGGYFATRHLIENGHKRIAFISAPLCSSVEERFAGYKQVLKEHDIPLAPEIVINGEFGPKTAGIEGLTRSGYENMKKLLTLPKQSIPTAIFATSDAIAVGVFNAIKEAGLKIPEDFALVGYDDSEYIKSLDVAITSVRQPLYLMGHTSARILIEEIEDGNGKKRGSEKVYLKPELIVRNSSLPVTRQANNDSTTEIPSGKEVED